MRAIIEEYGILIVYLLIGSVLTGIGTGIFVTIRPFVEAYINGLM